MTSPNGLRRAEEVVPRLGIRQGRPALRVGEVALYDRPLEHVAGHLDTTPLALPLRLPAPAYALVLCFATRPIDVRALMRELVRASADDGAVWAAVFKRKFERAGVPTWEEMQKAGLATGWVDNKVLSFGDELYASRFVRRRSRPSGTGGAS